MLFLAVVWSIAGAFLVVQFGLPGILGLATSRGWLDASLMMPRPVTGATGCSQADMEHRGWKADDPAAVGELRHAIWSLGRRLGFAAGVKDAGLRDAQLQPLLADIDLTARALALTPPRPPRIQRVADALHEFAVYLEADPECVAAELSARYGIGYGYLYKFGAVIGHAIPYQANGVGGVFAPQIEVYGVAAGIPRELWLPMTLESLDRIPGVDPRAQVSTIVARLDDFIRYGR